MNDRTHARPRSGDGTPIRPASLDPGVADLVGAMGRDAARRDHANEMGGVAAPIAGTPAGEDPVFLALKVYRDAYEAYVDAADAELLADVERKIIARVNAAEEALYGTIATSRAGIIEFVRMMNTDLFRDGSSPAPEVQTLAFETLEHAIARLGG
jgi:hypothetical protein